MQKVSTAYKESMKSLLREQGYILVTFHLVNQEVQEESSLEDSEQTYYSNDDNILAGTITTNRVYATLEQDFTKVDGSMYFLPRESANLSYYDTGIISADLVSEAQWSLTINTNVNPIDFKGLTINFGENYPTTFDIVCDTGQTLSVTDNDSSEWYTEEVFEDITSLTIIVYTMKNENSRVRIYEITFGYDLEYDNDYVKSSDLESYISPVCLDIPQIDFSMKLVNDDQYFNVDNPDSAINFLEIGQKIEIKYGYATPDADDIEWIEGQVLRCSEWNCDESSATICGVDFLRELDSTYYGGEYRPGAYGKTFYDIAVDILEEVGINDYYLDSILTSYHCRNPLPLVTHREALQLIANACQCILIQTRSGQIQIRSNDTPTATISSYSIETDYSNVENILSNDVKTEYTCFDTNYISVDSGMTFIPTDVNSYSGSTGYVSAMISDENGYFEENPELTITLDITRVYYYLAFEFGYAVPAAFTIYAYNDSVLVNQYNIESDEIDMVCNIVRDFDECNKFVIEFTKTAEPYNHIVVNYIGISTVAMFTMEKVDMLSSPIGTTNEVVKNIIIPYYTYSIDDDTVTIVNEEFSGEGKGEITYYFSSPYANYKIYLDDVLMSYIVTNSDTTNYFNTVEYESNGKIINKTTVRKSTSANYTYDTYMYEPILEDEDGNSYTAYIAQNDAESCHSCYFLTLSYNFYGTGTLKIVAQAVIESNKSFSYDILSRGSEVTWSNYLIYSKTVAEKQAEWLANYYMSPVEYEYETRGHPELDANDVIYQENEYIENAKVLITDCLLSFDGFFSGKVTVRRIEDEK